MRRTLAAAVVLAAVAAAGAACLPMSAAAQSESVSAPSYPGSKLAVSVPRTARAGSLVTVTASGSNLQFDPNPLASPAYTLDLFVHDRRILPTCPRSYSEELDNVIQLSGEQAIFQIIRSRNLGQSGAFRVTQKYRAGRARRVVYCAYVRLITDDAAVAARRQTLLAPRRR